MGYLLVFHLLAIVSFGFGCDYSDLGESHTMCKYADNACEANARGFSNSDADEMVRLHNEKRQFVASGQQKGQPGASNMKQVTWSSELATIAQRWADQCAKGHDENRKTREYPYVGQNAYQSWSPSADNKLDSAAAVNSWYNEVNDPGFSSSNINPFKYDPGTGHYTQLVWADTQEIGCGYSFYEDSNYYFKIVVCNYGPGGNWGNGAMYKTGGACSDCANGCSNDFNALCSPE